VSCTRCVIFGRSGFHRFGDFATCDKCFGSVPNRTTPYSIWLAPVFVVQRMIAEVESTRSTLGGPTICSGRICGCIRSCELAKPITANRTAGDNSRLRIYYLAKLRSSKNSSLAANPSSQETGTTMQAYGCGACSSELVALVAPLPNEFLSG
jgi:hypothetical protein